MAIFSIIVLIECFRLSGIKSKYMAKILLCAKLIILSLLLFISPLVFGLEKVYETAQPSSRPDYVPKLSDVSMRSMVPRKGTTVYDNTFLAAEAFHITRLDWVYPGVDASWIHDIQSAGYELQPSLNSNISDGPGQVTTEKGRILDVHGERITGPWMPWPNSYWGCANRREWRSVWLEWSQYYAGLGVSSFQHDDPRMNGAALYWHPGTVGDNNVGPGCFCEDCIFKFNKYLKINGLSGWIDSYPVNNFANTFLCRSNWGTDGSFTIFMVTRSDNSDFGLSGNGANGSGSVPRLYLSRRGISYNSLNTVNISTLSDSVEITVFTHDGGSNLKVYRNGTLAGSGISSAVEAFGGGGNLGIPLQANNQNIAGDIAEIIIYDRSLNTNERQGVEAYLGDLYGGISGIPMNPKETDLARNLKLWLSADVLSITHTDGAVVNAWPASAGFDAVVPSLTLPNGQTAGAPTFKYDAINGRPAVRFDGVNDFMTFYWFNIKDYVLNYVHDQNFRYASTSIRSPYENFQKQSVREFFDDVRPVLNSYAGRHVPISCNGLPLTDPTPFDLFDFGMHELKFEEAIPSYLYSTYKQAVEAGLAQMYTPPVVWGQAGITNWDSDYPQLRIRTRKAIATSYAFGGHMMAPWDHYMPEGNPRYFGNPDDYYFLFKMVRDNTEFFDGYEDAYVTGYDLSDTRYASPVPVTLTGGSGRVCAAVRSVPNDPLKPTVIHLVEWDDNPQPFSLDIQHNRFTDEENIVIEMIFNDEQADTNYTVTDNGTYSTVSLPALNIWAMITVKPQPHEVVRATVEEPDAVVVEFSGEVEPVSAQDIQNYSITPPLDIDSAVLGPEGKTVSLNLTQESFVDFTERYTLSVSDINSILGSAIEPSQTEIRYQGIWAWQYKMKLGFDSSNISEVLPDFPVLVKFGTDNFDYSQCLADGSDIRFTDQNGTDLHHEFETFNPDGETIAWVSVPQIDPALPDQYITMHWGNIMPDEISESSRVWSNGFSGVWHLGDDTKDSTANENHGTNFGSTVALNGAVGKSKYFDGTAKINVNDDNSLDFNDNVFTFEGWINKDALQTGMWLTKGGHWLEQSWEIGWGSTSSGMATYEYKSLNSANDISSANTWYHLAFASDGSTGRWYVNGETSGPVYSISSMAGLNNSNSLIIGGRMEGVTTSWFAGKVDEIRISSSERSQDWIRATYLSASESFINFGPVITKEDLNENGFVDSFDLSIFGDNWLSSGNRTCDLNYDDKINFADFAKFAENWGFGK